MRKFFVLISVQSVAITSILSLSAAFGVLSLPDRANGQELAVPVEIVNPEVEPETEAETEEDTPEAITLDEAITNDQLDVLLKPLTQEQLQVEADAWYGLLQEKAQDISDLEYDIKLRQDEAIGGAVDSEKEQEVIEVTNLKAEQTILVSRLTTVLDAFEAKGGDPTLYRQYSDVISGLEFNITDTEGLGLRFTTWLKSEEGGIRWGLNILKIGGILLAAMIIAPRAGKLADTALTRVNNVSTLFRGFIVMVVKRGVFLTGGLLALASIGVNLAPILAFVGGASFILAFALQSNLGNFASGLMLLINKPFDVGDEVNVGGYWAFVDSISLASTKLKDFSGSIVTLPNNTVWGGDIINYTHADVRKVMMGIDVKFTQDIGQVQDIWGEITSANPKVLKDPKPGSFPWNSSYNYKIGIGLNAWVKVEDHWSVYVELLKALQEKLIEHNIELTAPVQDLKVSQLAREGEGNQLPSLTASR